jgi:hypothetical protein
MLCSFFMRPLSERMMADEPTSSVRQADGTHNRLNTAIRTGVIECRLSVISGLPEGAEKRSVQAAAERMLSARHICRSQVTPGSSRWA